jgi:hypothetical protein
MMAKKQLTETLKAEVSLKAQELVETVLKPHYVQPVPEDQQFNYIVDIYTRWHGHYFYFCAKYCVPGPNAIEPFFESKFARLDYVGNERFNLSFQRYNGQWVTIHTDLSLDECLTSIKDDPWFAAS